MTVYPSQYAPIPIGDLENWNTDRTVDPVIMTRGIMYKTSSGWYHWDGQSKSDDAAYMRVSAIGLTIALSADAVGNRVSAFQSDAGNLRVSVIGTSALAEGTAFIGQVSAILKDNPINATYLGRVSTVGSVAISANQSLSALGLEGTAHLGSVSAVLVDDASITKFLGRVSALGVTATTAPLSADSSSVSAKQENASNLRVSAFSNDGALLRTSAIGQYQEAASQASAMGSVALAKTSADFLHALLLDANNYLMIAQQGAVSVNGIVPVSGTVNVNSLVGISGSVSLVANQSLSATLKEGTAFVGSVSANQAGTWEISSLGKEGTAFLGQVSATLKAGTANIGYVSAYLDNGSVSAKQGDAGLLKTSTLGGYVVGNKLSSYGGFTMNVAGIDYNGIIRSFTCDTNGLQQVSSLQNDATDLRVSAFSDNASLLRVSVIGTSAAGEGTSFIGQVSATLKAGTANIGYVSAYLDNGSVSAVQGNATNLMVSARSSDGALLRVSVIQDGAAALNISAKSDGANLFRTSSYLPVDTTGQVSIYKSLSLSASQAIKATAGALYGYYLWNTTTIPQYVKFTNTSGAINVGTDVPVATFMLPASAAANVWFGQGLKGFTAGIGIHASSAVADNATTAATASAVGGNIFYN